MFVWPIISAPHVPKVSYVILQKFHIPTIIKDYNRILFLKVSKSKYCYKQIVNGHMPIYNSLLVGIPQPQKCKKIQNFSFTFFQPLKMSNTYIFNFLFIKGIEAASCQLACCQFVAYSPKFALLLFEGHLDSF